MELNLRPTIRRELVRDWLVACKWLAASNQQALDGLQKQISRFKVACSTLLCMRARIV